MKILSISTTGLLFVAFLASLVDLAAVLPIAIDVALTDASIKSLEFAPAAFATTGDNIEFSPCDSKKQYSVTVKSVSLDPNPPHFS